MMNDFLTDAFVRLRQKLKGISVRVLLDPDGAEDVLQESFVRLWRKQYPLQSEQEAAALLVQTEVRGSSMTTYKLDFYRSVRFQVDKKTALEVAALVKADAAAAISAETEMTGDLLTYALVQPAGRGKTHRYLCYQARPEGPAWVITILYLEGSATLADLRSMFDKQ